jgi:hypothetical protein|tara:strand:- start:384 stop:824 length:441 start_codon:yes stop_codon:yes gene_type:complete
MNNSNCLTDNQGNPIPQVGGTCDLASMHIDASVIDQPSENDLYGQGMVNNGMLDWEFYQINPQARAGASPASQNDFYGNLYSLGSYYGDSALNYDVTNQQMNPSMPPPIVVEESCNCGSESSSTHSQNQMYFFIALLVGAYFFAKQ